MASAQLKKQEKKSKEFEFTQKHFDFVAGLVKNKSGIVLASHKKDMAYGRLVRRIRALNMNDFDEYCSYIGDPNNSDELMEFVNAITTNLTRFFREEHHFDHLADLLKKYNKQKMNSQLRIWSSACSSGMEPYSIAMTVADNLPALKSWDVKILATDIDTNMLAKSRDGIYKVSDMDNIPAKYHNKYCETDGDKLIMNEKLKDIMRFNHLNLLESWPFNKQVDIVFCRNVIIYFDKDTQRQIFKKMSKQVKSGGYLYIGHSETLNNVSDDFKLIGKTIYQRI